MQRLAEGGEAVEPREHDEVERERRQIDDEVGDAAPEHARKRSASGLRQRGTGQHRRANQQHLLQDQHERRRHDIACIAAHRVEDRLQQNVSRADGGERRLDQAAVGAGAARGEFGRKRTDRDRDATAHRSEQEKVGGVGIDRKVHGGALEHVALRLGRDTDHGEGLAAVERRARLCERVGADCYLHCAARVQGLHDAAAQLAQVVVDDRDRDLAQNLVEIRLRVIEAVDQWRQHQQDEGSAGPEHAPPFGGKGSADAGWGGNGRRRFRSWRCAQRAACDRTQA